LTPLFFSNHFGKNIKSNDSSATMSEMDAEALKKLDLDVPTALIGQYLRWAAHGIQSRGPVLFPTRAFRGQGRYSWPLLSSLARKSEIQVMAAQNLQVAIRYVTENVEAAIIARFKDQFNLSAWTELEILAFAQHHGAPTTLLDWSTNPFAGLWFAVGNSGNDAHSGRVFKLDLWRAENDDSGICPAISPPTKDHKCGHRVHLFECPSKIDRSGRQRSVFTKARPEDAFTPLDEIGTIKTLIDTFEIPAGNKRSLRQLLKMLGLDPFAMYGDPDSFGKSLDATFE
jgi:hypothetical protein